MVRKSLILEYGLMKKEFGFYADVDLWMELLHTHDAYYCAEPLILCPAKSVQPQQFSNDLIKFNMFMLAMHLKHRKKAFAGNLATLTKELAIFHAFALYHTSYSLLLVTKNFSFNYFVQASKHLIRYPYMIVTWALMLVCYPILRMILWMPTWIENLKQTLRSEKPVASQAMRSVNSPQV